MQEKVLVLHEWRADRHRCRLVCGAVSRKIEPKVMDLLFLLASDAGRVFSRAEILAAIWPNVTVGEDTLARTILKLRRALDDHAGAPRFIETISKRGYRLIPAAPTGTEAGSLARRAEAFYFRFTRVDNEAAIALYEQALAGGGDDPVALAGLANGLVQRAVRWSGPVEASPRNLEEALASGILVTPAAAALLARAELLGRQAVALAPRNPAALKALGLAMAAMARFAEARTFYARALDADPDGWGVLINLADLDGLEGDAHAAIDKLERAYRIMAGVYDAQIPTVQPWHAALGVLIGDRYRALGDPAAAQAWYRRVLDHEPVHEGATAALARTMIESGEPAAARSLCRDLVARIGRSALCEPLLAQC